MKVTTKLYEADVPNVNGVVYPKEELEKAVHRWNATNQFVTYEKYGTPSEKDQYDINPLKVAGKCKLSMDGNFVKAHITVMQDSPQGQALYDVINSPLAGTTMCLPCGIAAVSDIHSQLVTKMSIVRIVCASDFVDVGENRSNLFILEKDTSMEPSPLVDDGHCGKIHTNWNDKGDGKV